MATDTLQFTIEGKDEATKKIQKINRSINDLNRKVQSSSTKMSKSFGKARGAMGSIASKASQLGKAVASGTAVAGTAVAALGATSLNTAGDFQAAMNIVEAKSGATAEQIEKLEEQAKKMGSSTRFSATQAAEGYKFLSQAGMDVQEQLESMPKILQLATSQQANLGKTADIVTNTLSQFNLKSEETGRVTNLMAAATASANTDMNQFGGAMKELAPTANSLGISIEEVSAAIGVLGDAGIQGTEAGNSLSTALTRLSKPTKAMQDTMDQYNISMFDAQGNMKSLTGIIDEVNSSLEGTSQKQKAAAVSTLFGAEAQKQILALLDKGSESFSEYEDKITDTNQASQQAATMQKGLNNATKQLGSAFESAQLQLADMNIAGSSIQEWATKAVTAVTNLIKNINFSQVEEKINSVVSTIKGAVNWMINNKALVISIISGIATSIAVALVPSLWTSVAATWAQASATIAATWPFIALAAAVSGIVLWFQKSQWAQKKLQQGFNFLKNKVLPPLQTAFENFSGWFQSTALPAIKGFLSGAWDKLMQAFNWFAENIWPKLKIAWQAFSIIVMELWKKVLSPFLSWYAKKVSQNIDVTISSLKSLWKDVLVPLWKNVLVPLWKNVLVPLSQFLFNVFKVAFETVAQSVKFLWQNVLVPLWQNVLVPLWKNVLVPIGNFLKKAFKKAWESITDAVEKSSEKFQDIKDKVQEFRDKAVNMKDDVVSTFQNLEDRVTSAINSIIGPIQTATNALGNMKDAAGSAINSAKEAASFGGGGGDTEGRASGGPVSAGQTYEVGEGNNPELFKSKGKLFMIPGNDGEVLNNRKSEDMVQENQSTQNFNININMNGTFVGTEKEQEEFVEKIGRGLTKFLQKNQT